MRVLFLDLDTLRPDHLGCYGYHRNTSPNIDRIAGEGVRFENYHCSDAPCLPSRSSLVTGQFGINHGCVNHGGTNADLIPEGPSRDFRDRLGHMGGLWGVFFDRKLWTASISPFATRHAAWHFYSGFREMIDTGRGGAESAEEITPHVLDWIKRRGKDDNWLLHVNYWDPHTAYRAPEEFGNPFKDEPLPAWYTPERVATFKDMVGAHGPSEISMYDDYVPEQLPRQPGRAVDMDGVRKLVDGYDCGIRYMDDHIGILLDALKEEGVLDDLVIIVTSDHGENLCELGSAAEHGTADQITTRIPMIIRWPEMAKAGHVDTGLHYNIDLAPTMAEAFGQPRRTFWDGESFLPALAGEECGHEALILSQCAHGAQRAVRWEDWIYIRTYHDFYHLYPKEMLFNIADDPHECCNLAAERPDLCAKALTYYMDWHDEQMAKGEKQIDPLVTVLKEGGPYHSRGHLKKYCTYLEKTGRAWAIPELKKRHPREFAS